MPIVYQTHIPYDFVWFGHLSYCDRNGPILNFIREYLNASPKNIKLVIPPIDAIVDTVPRSLQTLIALKDISDEPCIVGTISTRNVTDPRIILLPLDDESFLSGVVTAVGRRMIPPPWETRKPILYWRGQCSGGMFPTLRYQVVERLHGNPLADTRLIRDPEFPAERMGGMNMSDETMFCDRRPLEEHMQFKYTIIVDGACIASSHQWMFASGCVPLMVSHPNNNYWFKRFLKPGVHYVPVNYDLSDIVDKLEWLVANDDEAKKIAANATEFAQTVLSSEFQQTYLRNELQRVLELIPVC
jgi:hypothetical protein